MTPTVGRIVLYRLKAQDCEAINRRRRDAREHMDDHSNDAIGVQVHVGNNVSPGDAYPMLIARVWGDQPESLVNGQVFLDGNDTFWATSVGVGEASGTWSWPVIATDKMRSAA